MLKAGATSATIATQELCAVLNNTVFKAHSVYTRCDQTLDYVAATPYKRNAMAIDPDVEEEFSHQAINQAGYDVNVQILTHTNEIETYTLECQAHCLAKPKEYLHCMC